MRLIILGKKITAPVIALKKAATKTAPAAMSFTFLIPGCISLLTTSQSFSMAVFNISMVITKAMQKQTATHSMADILNAIENSKAIIARTE